MKYSYKIMQEIKEIKKKSTFYFVFEDGKLNCGLFFYNYFKKKNTVSNNVV